MTAEAWHVSEANWETILSDVSYGDFIFQAGREVGLDNFQVESAIPEPATIALLSLGLLGVFRKKRFEKGVYDQPQRVTKDLTFRR